MLMAPTGAVSLSNDKQKNMYTKTKAPTREARGGGGEGNKENQPGVPDRIMLVTTTATSVLCRKRVSEL